MQSELILNALLNRYWKLYQDNGLELSASLSFNENKVIRGYRHPNERFWDYTGGKLLFLTKDKEVSANFNHFNIQDNHITIYGKHILYNRNSPNFILETQPENYVPPAFTPAKDNMPQFNIGEHTYGMIAVIEGNGNDLEIGKFTSIGPDVALIAGNHNYNFVTTYPFKSTWNNYWQALDDIEDHIYNKKTRIGNDVWIGTHVIIKGGVTIGDGAVIAAGSLVTKDVEPYSIVGGNPAKLLKKRFNDHQIESLLKIAWWNWDDKTIDERLHLIMSEDIDGFIKKFS